MSVGRQQPGGVLCVGVTGHIRLTAQSRRLIFEDLVSRLRRHQAGHRVLHGVTCLADGADRLFARAIRACAGTFDVILPEQPDSRRETGRLLRQARTVTTVPADPTPAVRYAAASEQVVRNCDVLIAVWDGTPDGEHGGTAHTVAQARRLGVPVEIVWPAGAQRRQVGGGSMSHSRRPPATADRTSG